MRRALRLAARGRYGVAPNPRVGAVVVAGGEVVGEGFHERFGQAHAETRALARAGERAGGATVYVTLEPCAHVGHTPPCTDSLIAAGVARVVACHRDPDPRTAGAGFARLRAAGIEVDEGVLAEDAVELNLPFLVPQLLGRPEVTVKWAMSLDGKIATASGESQWISSPAGRRWGLAQREEHDAVLVGSGTVLADDPRLDRRLGLASADPERPFVRVVLDRRLRTPPTARMLAIDGPVLVYTASLSAAPPRVHSGAHSGAHSGIESRRALEAAGATLVELDEVTPGAVLADLHRRGVASVLVEGGAGIAGAFVAAGAFDRVAIDCAPLLVGGERAPGPLGGSGAGTLAGAPRLERLATRRRGGDLIITGLREKCLPDLLRSLGVSSRIPDRPPRADGS